MKKTYINPELQVVMMNTCELLTGSKTAPVGGGSQGNPSALAPGLDWDEDEDEEDW